MLFKTLFLSLLVSSAIASPSGGIDDVITTKYQEARQPKVVSEQKVVDLNRAEKRKINIFLSNFAECSIQHFDSNDYDDKELIYFALRHNYLNNWKLFEQTDDFCFVKISQNYIERSVQKYFGISKFNHQSLDKHNVYENGYYKVECSDGGSDYFCQTQKMLDCGDGIYEVDVDLYFSMELFDVYESMEFWEGVDMEYVYFEGKIVAKVKKVKENGKERYKLLKYDLVEKVR